MGLMDFVKAAVENGATARGGYLQGQEEETLRNNAIARQAALDKMAQAKNTADIGELNARANYWNGGGATTRGYIVKTVPGKGLMVISKASGQPIRQATPDDVSSFGVDTSGDSSDTPQSPLDTMRGAVGLPPKGTTQVGGLNVDTSALPTVGVSVPGTPGQSPTQGPTSTKPSASSYIIPGTEPPAKTPTLRVSRAHIVDPGTKSIINVMSDGSVQTVRPATAAELARATYLPGQGGGAGGGGYTPADARADRAAQQAVSGAVAATQGDTTAARANINQSTLNPAVRASINNNPSLMGQVLDAYKAGKTKATDAHIRTQYSTPGMMATGAQRDSAMAAELAPLETRYRQIMNDPNVSKADKQAAKQSYDTQADVITKKYTALTPPGGSPPDDDDENDITDGGGAGQGY